MYKTFPIWWKQIFETVQNKSEFIPFFFVFNLLNFQTFKMKLELNWQSSILWKVSFISNLFEKRKKKTNKNKMFKHKNKMFKQEFNQININIIIYSVYLLVCVVSSNLFQLQQSILSFFPIFGVVPQKFRQHSSQSFQSFATLFVLIAWLPSTCWFGKKCKINLSILEYWWIKK